MIDEPLPLSAHGLALFIGDWEVKGSLTDGVGSFLVTGNWAFRQAADGWAVSGGMSTVIEGSGSFAECEVIGLDAVSGRVHLFSFNKFTIRDHVGGWSDDRTLVTLHESQSEEPAVTEEITVKFPTPNRMTGLVVEKHDERVVLTTHLEMTRTQAT